MAKIYSGLYGHGYKGGKQYSYLGGDNYRTGQNVVVPVTNKNGRTYNTMFTIKSSTEMGTKRSDEIINRVEVNSGKQFKFIEGRDIMSLPGAENYNSATHWRRQADYEAGSPELIKRFNFRASKGRIFANKNDLVGRFS